jgi:hypothetical protein
MDGNGTREYTAAGYAWPALRLRGETNKAGFMGIQCRLRIGGGSVSRHDYPFGRIHQRKRKPYHYATAVAYTGFWWCEIKPTLELAWKRKIIAYDSVGRWNEVGFELQAVGLMHAEVRPARMLASATA